MRNKTGFEIYVLLILLLLLLFWPSVDILLFLKPTSTKPQAYA